MTDDWPDPGENSESFDPDISYLLIGTAVVGATIVLGQGEAVTFETMTSNPAIVIGTVLFNIGLVGAIIKSGYQAFA